MDKYKFATITFEHEIYSSNYLNTRLASRKIFEDRGYIRVFSDVSNCDCPYEDWYIHPDLVDNELVTTLINKNEQNYKLVTAMKRYNEPPVHKIIDWKDIKY